MNENHIGEKYEAIIVGGGLAGLTAAALLANQGQKVLVLERGNLGGRAVTMNIKGYKFNFGAHAIYGRDTSTLRILEKELGIDIGWRDFNPQKAKYDLGSTLTDIPANIFGLFRTRVMKNASKVKFTYEILKTLIGTEKGHPRISIKKWMDDKQVTEDVQEMMLTLASSNFFTREPERIPSDVYFNYYQRLFSTNKPVTYVEGGWQALINEFVRVIEENGGEIKTKAKVTRVQTEEDQIVAVETTKETFKGSKFIFCIPPAELRKVFEETRIENILKHYAGYDASYVFVYDIGLKNRIDTPYTYIYDKRNKIFITDISYYDESCVPEGGQLLQAISYLTQEDLGNKEALEEHQEKIEQLYDKHFPGWRKELVVPRLSKRASAQEIKWTMNQQAMPIFLPDYHNLYFAGDWCQAKGQLSELSFSSAYEVSQLVLASSLLSSSQ
ncbi:FAD-dependent oxidoreductase [Niallia sp. XMNu-256]|uniref:phytoene desaturase family protein n=1 Tax=Niallia sp. XMNu-256 TaxID=3082444 RepID=UPI0030CEF6F3